MILSRHIVIFSRLFINLWCIIMILLRRSVIHSHQIIILLRQSVILSHQIIILLREKVIPTTNGLSPTAKKIIPTAKGVIPLRKLVVDLREIFTVSCESGIPLRGGVGIWGGWGVFLTKFLPPMRKIFAEWGVFLPAIGRFSPEHTLST